MATNIEEIYSRYNSPYVGGVTVGFTGIDPGEKGTALTEDEIRNLLSQYINDILISIDSGNIDPSADDPTTTPITPQIILQKTHEELEELLGGNENGHYHLTAEELSKLNEYPEFAALSRLIRHEALPDLLGGSATGHYHLTAEERFKLDRLINALIPAGQSNVVIPPGSTPSGKDNHEALANLFGGDADGHYHFTNAEWTQIRTLLDTVFPSGSLTPVFPSGPVNPSEDGTSIDDDGAVPDYSALFEDKDPEWKTIGLTAKYKTVKEEGRMYYGTVVKGDKVTQNALVVPSIYNNNRNDAMSLLITSSYDCSNFKELKDIAKARGLTLGDMVYAYIARTTTLQSKYENKRHFCFYCTYLNSTNKNIYYYGSGTSVHNPSTNNTGYLAGAYKDDAGNTGDQKVVCANGNGEVCVVGYKKDTKTSISTAVLEKAASIGMRVNPGCLRYGKGVFCATGADGAANSADGINWNVNKSAPKNMIGLAYRSDFSYKDSTGKDCSGAFIACSKATRIFYFSSDGYNWTQCSTTRVPLESVIAVAYNPTTKQYCVAGKPGNVTCFSQDFTNWRPSYVSKVKIEALDVTFAFDKFVLMPKNSATLYTYSN